MDLSSSKKRKSETDLGRPPIRKNPTIGGVFRLLPEEFENNSLNVEKRTPNVNSLLKTASGLLQKKNTKLQNPSGHLQPGGQVTSGQFTSGKQKRDKKLPISSGETDITRHRPPSGQITSGQFTSGQITSGQFTSGQFTSGQGQAVIQSKSSNDVHRLKGTSILDSGGNLLVKEILEKQNLLQLKQKLQNYRCAFKSLILELASIHVVILLSNRDLPIFLHPRRGAPCVTKQLLCSKSHYFPIVFALAHSKINQIALFFDLIIQEFFD